ncbi:MAG: recombinase family protein [Lachnospiraceae bacterium]|nr:recombinase family protein [Lachnospiraceae bacterium]
MARTSKKKKTGQMPLSRRFHVGVYARLSVEGSERKNESIDTQIAMAKQYLKEHPEMELYDCYTDLGRTGTNFKREGFERMMQDVRKKRIDCVIVKDLSRFGRNHIEAGNYIQKIFPFMGVRFIALADGIDTFGEKSGTDEMALNLKNLVNEMYARDIAQKVKSSKHSRQEQGSYTGGIPPYGYRAEWIEGKKCLFICPETSGIVKDIYGMYLSGKNMGQIAGELYESGIHRPGIYKKTGHVYQQEGEALEQWGTATVKFILTNPVYMGCLVQGTTCGKQYKIRNRHDVDSGDYSVKWGTHEPLISEDIFFQVAAMFEKSAEKYCNSNGFSKKVPLEEDIYAGVLFCGDCGKAMARVANAKEFTSGHTVRYYGYYCPASRRLDDLHCPTKSIALGVLDELVKTALYQEFALSDLRSGRLVKEYEKQAEEQKEKIRQEIVSCGKKQESGKKKGSELYQKYHEGGLSLEEFQQMKKEQERSLLEMAGRKEELQRRLDGMEREIAEKGKFLRNLMKCNEKTKLTKDVIHSLIRRIDVYAGHRVKITFAFRMNELLYADENGRSGKGGKCE